MRRIILSIVGGFVLPILYLLMAAILVAFFPEADTTAEGYPGWILLPVFFPVSIYEALRLETNGHGIFNTTIFRELWFFIPVISLYTGLSYLLLTEISRRWGKQKVQQLPPPPPLFIN